MCDERVNGMNEPKIAYEKVESIVIMIIFVRRDGSIRIVSL